MIAIMDWSKSNSEVWDPIRKQILKGTPEERVRQRLLRKMIVELGFPKGLIAVEKNVDGHRRFDIVCYANQKEGMVPLLLIECKADQVTEKGMRQAEGYNQSIGAPFLCIASADAIKTFWYENGKIVSVPFLPKYADLLRHL